jgi:site-specific DNA recombinase
MANKRSPDSCPSGSQLQQAVMYARVSSREQEKEGFSIPAQLEVLRAYAAANGFTILREFIDIETAKAVGRPGFGEMIDFLRAHTTCRTMLVEKTDRLYRNFKDYVTIDELAVEIHFVKENVVLSPDSRSHDKFMHGIKVLMAKNYIDNLSEEVRKGMTEKATEGIWPSYAPLGYENVVGENGKHVIVPDEGIAPLITSMFERYATGKYSVKQIGRMAMADGLAYRKTGASVPTSTIHKILRNRIYSGEFDFGGKTYTGTHQPIVSRELWGRVQDVLTGRRLRKTRQTKHAFAFRGLLSCGHCGCAMVAELKKGRYVYYHCTGFKGKCPEKYVREEVLEEQFTKLVRQIHFDPEVLAWAADAMQAGTEDAQREHEKAIARLEREHRRLQDRIEAMYADKLDGRIDCDFYDRKAAEYRAEQERVRGDIKAHEAERGDSSPILADLARRAGDLFATQPPAEKRRLLDFVVSRCSWAGGLLVPEWRAGFGRL